MAEKIQVKYEALDQLISQVLEQADQTKAVYEKLRSQTETLSRSWRGEGSDEFQQEMDDVVLPGLKRLNSSLEEAGNSLERVKDVFLQAEDEAVQQLPGGRTAVGANGNLVQQTEAEATESRLNENGITLHSSGNCRDRNNSTCTSVEGIREETVNGLIAFRNAVGVDLVITGGTEDGHTEGELSHANGYKVDIRLNPTVNSYIVENFEYIGQREGDEAEQYRDANGNVFALEDDHWDVTFP